MWGFTPHPQQGYHPCTHSAKCLLYHTSNVRVCLGNDGGLCSPQTPGSRGIPPAPILRRGKRFLPNFFSHVGWETKENAHATGRPTGAMKMKKKAGQESLLSCRFFLIFPGCKASGRRCFTPPSPWPAVRAANSQSCNRPFANGFLRGAGAAANSQNFCCFLTNSSLRVALQHRHIACKIHIAISGIGSRGNALHRSSGFTGKLFA